MKDGRILRLFRAGVELALVPDGEPLPADLKDSMKTPMADIANIGDRNGGMLVAGLFLQRFVEGSGGAIRFESRPGRTVFTVRLRVAEAPPEAGPVVQDLPAPSG